MGIEHEQVHLEVGDYADDVDEGLVPILRPIWQAGIETVSGCQNAGESLADLPDRYPHMADHVASLRDTAYIDFYPDGAQRFFNLIAMGEPSDEMYFRMSHWLAPNAWQTTLILLALDPGDFQLYGVKVFFPMWDIAEIAACLERCSRRSAPDGRSLRRR